MVKKIFTFEELEKLEFEEVSEISIGNTEYSDVKVHLSDEQIIIDGESDEKYFVYDSIGRNTFYYTVQYEFEEDSVEDESEEKISLENKEAEKPKSFWRI